MDIHTKRFGRTPPPRDTDLVLMVAMDNVYQVAHYLCHHTVSRETYYHAIMAVRSRGMLQALIGRGDVNEDLGRIFWDAARRGQDTGDWSLAEMLSIHPLVQCDSLSPYSLSYAVMLNSADLVRDLRAQTNEGLDMARQIAEKRGATHLMPYLYD
jgi:hypothetical protein